MTAPVEAPKPEPATAAPLAPDADVREQIERARLVVESEAKGKPQTEEPSEADEQAAAPEVDEEPKAAKSPRELLDAGKVEEAFAAAFGQGVKPADFKIDPGKWVALRKAEKASKAKLAERESALNQREESLKAWHGQLVPVFEQLKPMAAARKAYKEGRVTEAVKLAFEDDYDTFNKKGLREFHKGAATQPDPVTLEVKQELERVKQELAAERAEKAKLSETELTKKNTEFVQAQLAELDDPTLAKLAKKPRAVARVLEILQEHYDERTETTLTVPAAAAMVRDWLVDEFGDYFDAPRNRSESESPRRAGKKPERPATATLSTRGATEASTPGQPLDDIALIQKYARLAKASNG